MQTIDQKCAKNAYEAYIGLKDELKKEEDIKKVFGYAKKLPMMIIHSGLGNAIMFKYAKDNHNKFHKYFLKWLTNIEPETENPGNRIIQELTSDATKLRYYTAKAMRWLEWFNRFADTEK